MHWIIDGYNVIHTYPALEKDLEKSLERARMSLIEMCEWLAGSHGNFRRMTIVFDGKSEFSHLPPYKSSHLEVVYSETHETADNRIIKLLEARDVATSCAVVSNDNYVRNHAKANQARVMDVQGFIDFYHSLKSRGQRKSEAVQKQLPRSLADDITDSYKKHLGLD